MQPSTSCPAADLVAEELPVEPLPHEPALHVGERDDDGVDRARLDLGSSSSKRQHAAILFRPAWLTCQGAGARNTRLKTVGDPWEDA